MTGLFDLAIANPFWVWAAIGALVLAVEVATGSGWLLWPAASAGVVAVATLVLDLPGFGAVGLYAGLTILLTLLARRLWPSRQVWDADDINDNVARLVGHHGKAVTSFHGRDGRVFIDGKEWAADLEDDTPLARGAAVEVTGVNGARLRVRPAR